MKSIARTIIAAVTWRLRYRGLDRGNKSDKLVLCLLSIAQIIDKKVQTHIDLCFEIAD